MTAQPEPEGTSATINEIEAACGECAEAVDQTAHAGTLHATAMPSCTCVDTMRIAIQWGPKTWISFGG